MTYKVALASTDGKVVNQHFGQARTFHLFSIHDSGGYQFIGTRDVEPCCNEQHHELDAFEAVADALDDVQAILVSRIGEGARAFLESRGFVVYEAPYPVEALLQTVVEKRLYEVDKWRSNTRNCKSSIPASAAAPKRPREGCICR